MDFKSIGVVYFFKADIWSLKWSEAWKLHRININGSSSTYAGNAAIGGAIASALVGSIMSYEAWNNVTFVAGEITNPRKNIGLSLLLGTVMVAAIYIFLNLMFTAVLPMDHIALTEKDRVGIAASEAIFGSRGTAIIAVLIMIATFGCNNGLILAGARVYYSMSRDGVFFYKIAKLNKHAVPEFALWVQCVIACILCLSGRYGDLLDMITFVAVIFYVLTIAGIFILRYSQPDAERPYKAPLHPFLPGLYILMGLAFCFLLIIYKPQFTWPGLFIVLSGIPVFYLLKLRR
ncbi:MAG TPA: amino acid permease [Dyadobacter sp.]|jgi:APA family basic amino acid/polyamine antiporter|nr:amino acid permease [Dyadobacter sp.]